MNASALRSHAREALQSSAGRLKRQLQDSHAARTEKTEKSADDFVTLRATNVLKNEQGTDEIKSPGQFLRLDKRDIAQSSLADIFARMFEDRRRDVTTDYAHSAPRQWDGETARAASEVQHRGERNVAAEK